MASPSEKKSDAEKPETKTLYNEIEELAELQFTVDQVALIVECKPDDISGNPAAQKAYDRGSLKAEAEVRRAMLQMAKQGSTPAQKQFMELVTSKTPATNNWFD